MTNKTMLPQALTEKLKSFADGVGSLVVLTGAGISAESGIPTFRGEEGYWTVGSKEYHPQEMATRLMFSRHPDDVWSWYLYRRTVCRNARPNPGHQAVVDLERTLGNRFLLITQNVDGLHLRAGNSLERTFQIHGNIDYGRCSRGCCNDLIPLSEDFLPKGKGEPVSEAEKKALVCPACGGRLRPHVLWFDECYDEEKFRFQSSIKAASAAAILLVVGTSGATNLPMQVGQIALTRGATIIDINPTPNPFSQLAQRAESGFYVAGSGTRVLPLIVSELHRFSSTAR